MNRANLTFKHQLNLIFASKELWWFFFCKILHATIDEDIKFGLRMTIQGHISSVIYCATLFILVFIIITELKLKLFLFKSTNLDELILIFKSRNLVR